MTSSLPKALTISVPSNCISIGISPAAKFAKVGIRSNELTGSSLTCPALICKGHRITPGTLIPASWVCSFIPLKSPGLPCERQAPPYRFKVSGPLSEVKMTSVFSATLFLFKQSIIIPTAKSMFSTLA